MSDRQSGIIAAIVMTAVFAVGTIFGIALDHRVLHQPPARQPFGMELRAGGGPVMIPGAMPGRRRPPSPNVGRTGPGPERALDALARDLELTPEQLAVADSILRHEFEAVNGIREDTWPKMQAVMTETRRKLDSLLSPSQRDRYHAMLAEQERRFRTRDVGRPQFPSHQR